MNRSNRNPLHPDRSARRYAWLLPVWLAALAGCGTTRWSDTQRTGTEQLLISSAIDKAVNNIDFRPLAGKEVFFDTQFLTGTIDQNYVVSSLRQQMLAQGCQLKEKRDDARYVVEARIGALGTNRRDVMLGVPAVNLPSLTVFTGVPAAIPEVPVAKTTDQEGIAKLAVFAYNRQTLQPVWQSGAFPVASNAKDSWMLGIGPFQRGSIYDGTRFAGSRLIFSRSKQANVVQPKIPVTAEAIFDESAQVAAKSATASPAPDAAIAEAKASDMKTNETKGQKPDGATTAQNNTASPAPAASGPTAPGPSSPTQAGPASPASYDVPAGHIVRLPAVEQAEASGDPPSAAVPGERAPETARKESDSFNLLEPRTWF